MNGKYCCAREAFGDGSLSWTDDKIAAQLVSAAYQFHEGMQDAGTLSGKVGAPATLNDKTMADGWARAAMITFKQVSGERPAGIVFYRESDQMPIAFIESVDGFPLATNGGDIELEIPAPGIFRL